MQNPIRFSGFFFLAAAIAYPFAAPTFAADQTCADPAASPPQSGVCAVTAGDNGRLLRGTVLLEDGVVTNGSVMVDASGTIVCAGCGCQSATGADTATRIDCAQGVISPGLIDAYNHVTFSQNVPAVDSGERYEHRNDWRTGKNSHTTITVSSSATTAQLRWGELRAVIAGTTSMNGFGSTPSLVRNLDSSTNREGLTSAIVHDDTFPLNDSDGREISSGCDGYAPPLPTLPVTGAYEFVVAEGINAAARNEFLCLAGLQAGAVDVLSHSVLAAALALRATDAQAIADHDASVVWQPRNDLRLYGMTAPATLLDSVGVPIALGTNWTLTGSYQIQRELACADSYNTTYLDHHFSDAALWRMVTVNSAAATGFATEIGRLEPGHKADIAVFDARSNTAYRAIIAAQAADVVLVLKGGVPMFGEADVVAALGGGDGICDSLVVCANARRLCVQRETGVTLESLAMSNASNYPLFQCDPPVDEPTCQPQRSAAAPHAVPPFFTGIAVAGDADGDGVADGNDVCPKVFDPPRPMDGLIQADGDSDGVGDACDVCPLDNTNTCDRLFANDFE